MECPALIVLILYVSVAEKWSWQAHTDKGTALLYRWKFHSYEKNVTTYNKV